MVAFAKNQLLDRILDFGIGYLAISWPDADRHSVLLPVAYTVTARNAGEYELTPTLRYVQLNYNGESRLDTRFLDARGRGCRVEFGRLYSSQRCGSLNTILNILPSPLRGS
jgi:hypothetical protein